MKRSLGLFIFLLLFSRCEKVEPPLQEVLPVTKTGVKPILPPSQPRGTTQAAATTPPAGPSRMNPGGSARDFTRSVHIPKPDTSTPLRSDSPLVRRLEYLRSMGIEPDMNEPMNRKNLLSPVENGKFQSMITLSRESFLKVDFDNDILDYTDRFYTNGMRLTVISPALQMNPLRLLMVPYWSSGMNYYGISVVQNMFTPSTTKKGGIQYGDRPYASYLAVESFKITNDPVHAYRQTSGLSAGIIGPGSYGEWVQRSFHNSVPTNNEPLGWEYQVRNDLVLNYTVACEKGVMNGRHAELLVSATGNLGTLYTNISAGAQLRAGWFNPFFANLGISRKQRLAEAGLRKSQFFLFVRGSGKAVGYDATLQGGLLNRTSPYTIPGGHIARFVFQGSCGLTMSVNGVRLDVEQFLLSPEFSNGWWHKWVHIGLTFCL